MKTVIAVFAISVATVTLGTAIAERQAKCQEVQGYEFHLSPDADYHKVQGVWIECRR